MTAPIGESGPPCPDEPLEARIEALLVTTDRPLNEVRIADLLGLSGSGRKGQITAAIDALNEQYATTGRTFRVERLAGGWQMLTVPSYGPVAATLQRDRQETRLSQAALETLAIIAYRQPVLRAEVEAIRGVACGEVIRGLMERRLVKIVGRAEELGRPMLYGTTREFLRLFGLAGLDDLPQVQGLPDPARLAAAGDAGAKETSGDNVTGVNGDTAKQPEDDAGESKD